MWPPASMNLAALANAFWPLPMDRQRDAAKSRHRTLVGSPADSRSQAVAFDAGEFNGAQLVLDNSAEIFREEIYRFGEVLYISTLGSCELRVREIRGTARNSHNRAVGEC